MIFLKIILFIVIFYYVFFLIIRYLFPYILKRHIKKTQERFYGKQQEQQKHNRKEGDVNIDYVPEDKKKKNGDIGEYVDYEEVDD